MHEDSTWVISASPHGRANASTMKTTTTPWSRHCCCGCCSTRTTVPPKRLLLESKNSTVDAAVWVSAAHATVVQTQTVWQSSNRKILIDWFWPKSEPSGLNVWCELLDNDNLRVAGRKISPTIDVRSDKNVALLICLTLSSTVVCAAQTACLV